MTAIFNLFNRLDLPIDAIKADGFSTYAFAILAAIAGFISLKSGQIISKKGSIKECKVTVRFCGKDIEFSGFADSGNFVNGTVCYLYGQDGLIALDGAVPKCNEAPVEAFFECSYCEQVVVTDVYSAHTLVGDVVKAKTCINGTIQFCAVCDKNVELSDKLPHDLRNVITEYDGAYYCAYNTCVTCDIYPGISVVCHSLL